MLSNLTVCIAAFDIKKHLDGVRPNFGQNKATVSRRGRAPTIVGVNYLLRELFAAVLQ